MLSTPRDTTRLRFRPFDVSDLSILQKLFGDQEVMAFYPRPWTSEETYERILELLDHYRRYGFGRWAVHTLDGEFVGECGLTRLTLQGRPRIEVSYHIMACRQAQGFATEAARACKEYLANIGEEELVAVVYPGNFASESVAKKIGLVNRTESADSKGNPFSIFSGRTGL